MQHTWNAALKHLSLWVTISKAHTQIVPLYLSFAWRSPICSHTFTITTPSRGSFLVKLGFNGSSLSLLSCKESELLCLSFSWLNPSAHWNNHHVVYGCQPQSSGRLLLERDMQLSLCDLTLLWWHKYQRDCGSDKQSYISLVNSSSHSLRWLFHPFSSLVNLSTILFLSCWPHHLFP